MWNRESSGSLSIVVWMSASSPPRPSNRLRAIILLGGKCRGKSPEPIRLKKDVADVVLRDVRVLEGELTEEEVNQHTTHETF